MAPPSHTTEKLREWWQLYAAAGYNVVELARRAGGSRATWEHRIRAAQTRLALEKPVDAQRHRKTPDTLPERSELLAAWRAFAANDWSVKQAARAVSMPEGTFTGRLEAARRTLPLGELRPDTMPGHERQRFLDRVREAQAEARAANRRLAEAEDLRAAVFHLAAQPLAPPEWTVCAAASGGARGTPILFTSDFQWGEVIRASELDGVNEFNRDVASRRYRLLVDKAIELAFGHMVRPKYDGLLYIRGGDMISGEIHADLRETNDLQAVPAVKDLVEHECAGLEVLLTRFGRVHVVSVPGNHGRITEKPQSKGYAARNLDTLSAWWLESQWRREKRITWQTPASGDALVPLYGYRFLVTHGDRIGSRGGQGFIGSVATITRGMKKVADYYASLGKPLDLQFVGHFHTPLELEYGFANGSLPGYSQYARDLRMTVQPPKQWLVFAHPQHMITARWPILLEPRPRLRGAA